MADLNAFQSEVRNLLVASNAYVLLNPTNRIVDAFSMKEVQTPRTGLRDSGGTPRIVDQGPRFAHDAVLGVQIEAKSSGTVRTLAGLFFDAVHAKQIEPTGWRPAMVLVTNEQPIVFFEAEKLFAKVLTVQTFLQPAT